MQNAKKNMIAISKYVLIVGYKNNIISLKNIIKIILYIISFILFTISIISMLRYHFENQIIEIVGDEANYYLKEDNMSELLPQILKIHRLEDYDVKYGSTDFGEKAYYFNNLKIWSMSFCIAFIWCGIWLKNKKFKIIGKIIKYIAIVVFIIFQLLPIGYDIYVINSTDEESNYNVIDYDDNYNNKEIENTIIPIE